MSQRNGRSRRGVGAPNPVPTITPNTLGTARGFPEGYATSATDRNHPSIDVSHLQKPIETNLFGLQNVLGLYETATQEVQNYVSYECNVIYECRVCRTLFRSLANFILHKRQYCREVCGNKFKRNEDTDSHEQIIHRSREPPEAKKKTLSTVVNNLQVKNESWEAFEEAMREIAAENDDKNEEEITSQVTLEEMEKSACFMFQNVGSTSKSFMKEEVMEIHSIFDGNEAILGADGKIINPTRPARHHLSCHLCKLRFSTKKTLKHHFKYKHNDTKNLYVCPENECSTVFANTWSVFRHLYKVHRKNSSQVKKLRDVIQNSVIKRGQLMQEEEVSKEETVEEDLDKQWFNNFEKGLLICCGCGKRFDRKAALNSHSLMCSKRQALKSKATDDEVKPSEESKTKKIEYKSEVKEPTKGSKRKPSGLILRIVKKPKSETNIAENVKTQTKGILRRSERTSRRKKMIPVSLKNQEQEELSELKDMMEAKDISEEIMEVTEVDKTVTDVKTLSEVKAAQEVKEIKVVKDVKPIKEVNIRRSKRGKNVKSDVVIDLCEDSEENEEAGEGTKHAFKDTSSGETEKLDLAESEGKSNENEVKLTENDVKLTENEAKLNENEAQLTENEATLTENETTLTENEPKLVENETKLDQDEPKLSEENEPDEAELGGNEAVHSPNVAENEVELNENVLADDDDESAEDEAEFDVSQVCEAEDDAEAELDKNEDQDELDNDESTKDEPKIIIIVPNASAFNSSPSEFPQNSQDFDELEEKSPEIEYISSDGESDSDNESNVSEVKEFKESDVESKESQNELKDSDIESKESDNESKESDNKLTESDVESKETDSESKETEDSKESDGESKESKNGSKDHLEVESQSASPEIEFIFDNTPEQTNELSDGIEICMEIENEHETQGVGYELVSNEGIISNDLIFMMSEDVLIINNEEVVAIEEQADFHKVNQNEAEDVQVSNITEANASTASNTSLTSETLTALGTPTDSASTSSTTSSLSNTLTPVALSLKVSSESSNEDDPRNTKDEEANEMDPSDDSDGVHQDEQIRESTEERTNTKIVDSEVRSKKITARVKSIGSGITRTDFVNSANSLSIEEKLRVSEIIYGNVPESDTIQICKNISELRLCEKVNIPENLTENTTSSICEDVNKGPSESVNFDVSLTSQNETTEDDKYETEQDDDKTVKSKIYDESSDDEDDLEEVASLPNDMDRFEGVIITTENPFDFPVSNEFQFTSTPVTYKNLSRSFTNVPENIQTPVDKENEKERNQLEFTPSKNLTDLSSNQLEESTKMSDDLKDLNVEKQETSECGKIDKIYQVVSKTSYELNEIETSYINKIDNEEGGRENCNVDVDVDVNIDILENVKPPVITIIKEANLPFGELNESNEEPSILEYSLNDVEDEKFEETSRNPRKRDKKRKKGSGEFRDDSRESRESRGDSRGESRGDSRGESRSKTSKSPITPKRLKISDVNDDSPFDYKTETSLSMTAESKLSAASTQKHQRRQLVIKSAEYVDRPNLMCKPCKTTFKKYGQLMKHMSVHFNWYLYRCNNCSFRCYDHADCLNHVKVQHPEIPVPGKLVAQLKMPETREFMTDFVPELHDFDYPGSDEIVVKTEPEPDDIDIKFEQIEDVIERIDETNQDYFSDRDDVDAYPEEIEETNEYTTSTSREAQERRRMSRDPAVQKMIMEVIFGTVQNEENARPVRNRTIPKKYESSEFYHNVKDYGNPHKPIKLFLRRKHGDEDNTYDDDEEN